MSRNRIWTRDDDKQLLELHASGRSVMSIAAALKRSQAAIEGRLYVLRKRGTAVDPVPTASVGHKWLLEIYRAQGGRQLIATVEFESLALLWQAVVADRGKQFIVEAPAGATAADRIMLTDLRAQDFDITFRTPTPTR